MSNKLHYFVEDNRGSINTKNDIEAMDYITEEGHKFHLEKSTDLTIYKLIQHTPIELDPEDETSEKRMA
ncbi:hypothetical protein BDB00DRAFT_735300, partial [Zychaea mexicana]|uniref:uncharacterized protein n=1 Tax=Zychaea mexicana TaxID=64656 RepID=UPI0022FEFEC5